MNTTIFLYFCVPIIITFIIIFTNNKKKNSLNEFFFQFFAKKINIQSLQLRDKRPPIGRNLNYSLQFPDSKI